MNTTLRGHCSILYQGVNENGLYLTLYSKALRTYLLLASRYTFLLLASRYTFFCIGQNTTMPVRHNNHSFIYSCRALLECHYLTWKTATCKSSSNSHKLIIPSPVTCEFITQGFKTGPKHTYSHLDVQCVRTIRTS